MPVLKSVDRSATVAFCPVAPLLAAGTVAGAIDMSFSTSSVLEVRRCGGLALCVGHHGLWVANPHTTSRSLAHQSNRTSQSDHNSTCVCAR